MFTLGLLFAGFWLFCFAALGGLLWQFRLTAMAAVCVGLAGLRVLLSGPWGPPVALPAKGSPAVHLVAAIGNGVQAAGPIWTGLVLVGLAGWIAWAALSFWAVIRRGHTRLPPP